MKMYQKIKDMSSNDLEKEHMLSISQQNLLKCELLKMACGMFRNQDLRDCKAASTTEHAYVQTPNVNEGGQGAQEECKNYWSR